MKSIHPLVRAALLLGATAGAGLPAQALTTAADGSGWLSLDNGVNKQTIVFGKTDNGVVKAASGQGETITRVGTQPVAGAVGSGGASASAGQVRAAVSGLAFIAPLNPQVPSITHGTARVWVETSASFQDTVELKSATLAPGTVTQFRASFSVHAETDDPGHIGPAFAGYDSGLWNFQVSIGPYFYKESFPNGVFTTIPDRNTVDFGSVFTGRVGDIITVSASLRLAADNRAGYYLDTNNQLQTYGGRDDTVIDASNTLNIFVTPLTAGVQAIGSSGHDYRFATAVPEPSAAWLWLLGLGAVGLGLGRRRAGPAG
jgi:PEP-CTERM motif